MLSKAVLSSSLGRLLGNGSSEPHSSRGTVKDGTVADVTVADAMTLEAFLRDALEGGTFL